MLNAWARLSTLTLTLMGTSAAGLLLLVPALGHADELDNIQRSRESAEMKYVNELASGKYKTAEQREALKKEYLEPYDQKTKEYFKSISALPTARPVGAEEIELRSGQKTDLSQVPLNPQASADGSGSGQVTGHAVSTGSSSPPPPDKNSLRPEFVLDGSGVPKEITFGAPTFDEAKPSPSPSPALAPNPAAPSLKKPGKR